MIARTPSLVLALTLCACASGAEPATDAAEEASSLPVSIAHQGVCDARTMAQAGNVEGAALTFESRAHAELHALADRLSATDRAAAAGLLQAKQRVEAALVDPASASPEAVVTVLAALEGEIATAAEALGLERPVCAGAAA